MWGVEGGAWKWGVHTTVNLKDSLSVAALTVASDDKAPLESAKGYANIIREYNHENLEECMVHDSSSSKVYCVKQNTIFADLLKCIKAVKRLEHLTHIAENPDNKYKPIPRLVLLTRGTKDNNKYEILNSVLVNFVQSHIMKQPAAIMKK